MIIIRMVLFSLRAARSRVAADKKPTEKNNGDDKNGHREKNTQSHDVTPEAKNMTCPATKPLSRCIATAYRKTSLSYWISPPGFNQYSERNPADGTFYPDT
jgi:hypothetical protein